jgi:SAM-dependent methyltransferase
LAEQARLSHGQDIVEATFEEAQLRDSEFDIVTLWDVLEHVVDPQVVLEKARRVLRPGGLLALNTPNIDSSIAHLLGSRWPLLLPEHLYYFSRRSLRLLLQRCGFRFLTTKVHIVWFSLGYLLHRLEQHSVWGARPLARLIGVSRLGQARLPLLLGEIMLIARSS